jgi:hypothetical protein
MAANFIDNPNCPQNFLSGVGFQFQLTKYPQVAFYCQSANVPSLNLANTVQATRMNAIPHPGDEINFGDLQLRFLVDEQLKNYGAIHNWIRGLGHPESGNDYNEYLIGEDYDEKTYSDGTLFILDSNFRRKFAVKFKDLFPVTLSDLTFDSTYTDTEYFASDVTFKYTIYEIVDLETSTKLSTITAPSVLLTAANTSPVLNESLVLNYFSTNSRFLAIDNNVGVVNPNEGTITIDYPDLKAKALATGSQDSITFTITATGFNGASITSSVNITLAGESVSTSVNRVCIAIIDESDSQNLTTMATRWSQFRTNYPDRIFYLLQPNQGNYSDSISTLKTPAQFLEESDPNTIDI